MTTFIAKIETLRKGRLEFYFASIETIHGKKYFVTTMDNDARSHVFYMIQLVGTWRIDTSLHKIQNWILDLEYDLANIIQEKG